MTLETVEDTLDSAEEDCEDCPLFEPQPTNAALMAITAASKPIICFFMKTSFLMKYEVTFYFNRKRINMQVNLL